jgi:predicted O-methyltransferase YrrM
LTTRAEQIVERRNRVLRSFVALMAGERARQPLQILEVGSMVGESAIVWHQGLRAHNEAQGRITCVDPWVAYEGKAGVGQQLDNDQNRRLASGEAFAEFQDNIARAGAAGSIDIRRGFSDDILPSLAPESFDIIYIDGDHSYAQVRQDLANAAPLVRDGGLLCGDDLEVLFSECNQALCLKWAELGAEYVRDPATGLGYHPGVSLAVFRHFGQVSRWGLTWAMRRRGPDWVKVTLPDFF